MEEQKTQQSHKNFKSGLSDYHDGGNVTHYNGNQENREHQVTDEELFSDPQSASLEGKVANGNDVQEEDQNSPQ